MSTAGVPIPNYTQYPNVLLDSLADFSGAESKVLSCIVRHTFGWHKDKATLSNTRIATLTGLDKSTVIKALHSLQERGLVVEGGVTQNGTGYTLAIEAVEKPDGGLENPTTVVGKSDPYKERETNTDTNVSGATQASTPKQGLRDRVMRAIDDALSPNPSYPKAKEGMTPQQRQVQIIDGLWRELWGDTYRPDPGAIVRLISSYGGYKGGGTAILANAMLGMAHRDIAGGPLKLLMTESHKHKKAAAQRPVYQDVQVAPREQIQRTQAELEAGF